MKAKARPKHIFFTYPFLFLVLHNSPISIIFPSGPSPIVFTFDGSAAGAPVHPLLYEAQTKNKLKLKVTPSKAGRDLIRSFYFSISALRVIQ